MKIVFLSKEQVEAIHSNQIELYGGRDGIDNPGMVESAVMAPRATFDGKFLYQDLWLMAAVYLFGLANNHGFTDGNKRTAALSADVFLYMNGYIMVVEASELEEFMVRVVDEKLTRETIAAFLKSHSSIRQVLEK